MSEIVNLRQARKRRSRAEKEAQATANRAQFGRGKAERKQIAAERAKAARDLDGKKLPGAKPADKTLDES